MRMSSAAKNWGHLTQCMLVKFACFCFRLSGKQFGSKFGQIFC